MLEDDHRFSREFLQRDASMRPLWSDRQIALITCLNNLNVLGASLNSESNNSLNGPDLSSEVPFPQNFVPRP